MKQHGFTLIEMVTVVVLLAILASVSLPRFFNITESAHSASVAGTTGALSSALSIAHAKWLASGQPTTQMGMATLDFGPSDHVLGFTNQGWPHAAALTSKGLSSQDILGKGGDDGRICAHLAAGLLTASDLMFGAGLDCGKDYCADYQSPFCVYTYQKDLSKPRRILYNTLTGQVEKDVAS